MFCAVKEEAVETITSIYKVILRGKTAFNILVSFSFYEMFITVQIVCTALADNLLSLYSRRFSKSFDQEIAERWLLLTLWLECLFKSCGLSLADVGADVGSSHVIVVWKLLFCQLSFKCHWVQDYMPMFIVDIHSSLFFMYCIIMLSFFEQSQFITKLQATIPFNCNSFRHAWVYATLTLRSACYMHKAQNAVKRIVALH